jgi:hypothetical protein
MRQKINDMKENPKFNLVQDFIEREFPDSLLPEEERELNKEILNRIGLNPGSAIYQFFRDYETDSLFIDEEERSFDSFLFDELALLPDIEDLWKYIQDEWDVPAEYLPISNVEAGFCTLFNLGNGKVFFCDLGLVDNIDQNSEKTWNSFEDYIMEYLEIEPKNK